MIEGGSLVIEFHMNRDYVTDSKADEYIDSMHSIDSPHLIIFKLSFWSVVT